MVLFCHNLETSERVGCLFNCSFAPLSIAFAFLLYSATKRDQIVLTLIFRVLHRKAVALLFHKGKDFFRLMQKIVRAAGDSGGTGETE